LVGRNRISMMQASNRRLWCTRDLRSSRTEQKIITHQRAVSYCCFIYCMNGRNRISMHVSTTDDAPGIYQAVAQIHSSAVSSCSCLIWRYCLGNIISIHQKRMHHTLGKTNNNQLIVHTVVRDTEYCTHQITRRLVAT
jgi:hypothetical protein